jgi:flagellar protein FliS
MSRRLLHANLKNDVPAIEEVHRLLSDLREAWVAIGDKVAQPRPPPPPRPCRKPLPSREPEP